MDKEQEHILFSKLSEIAESKPDIRKNIVILSSELRFKNPQYCNYPETELQKLIRKWRVVTLEGIYKNESDRRQSEAEYDYARFRDEFDRIYDRPENDTQAYISLTILNCRRAGKTRLETVIFLIEELTKRLEEQTK